MQVASAETIAEKLDRIVPVKCEICSSPLKRASKDWPICKNCGLDVTGPDIWLIARTKVSA